MTKWQVAKHKTVIEWWLSNTDKGVLVYFDANKGWVRTDNPDFHTNMKYIKNDEYVELRKAQADGKVIEFDSLSSGYGQCKNEKWKPLPGEIDDFNHYKLRIKPDEPQFKAGDWVYFKDNDIPLRFIPDQYPDSDYTLWVPKRGEWCVFYDNVDDDNFAIQKYLKRSKWPDGTYGYSSELVTWTHCIPYIRQSVEEMK